MSSETNKMSQKDYLKKYLAGGTEGKKKKKKKLKGPENATVKAKVKVIDDDIDISKLQPLDESALDLYELNEDCPQVVGIVDERPEELKVLDQYKQTQRWKVLGNSDGDGVSVSASGGSKPTDRVPSDEEDVFSIRPAARGSNERSGKHKSDSSPPRRKRKDDSDESPPRKKEQNDSDASPPRKRTQNDSDTSPPRRRRQNDSDESPPRHKRDAPRSRKSEEVHKSRREPASNARSRKNSDSDPSPPRKRRPETNASPHRQKSGSSRKEHSDSDTSPPRRRANRKEPEDHTSHRPRIKKEEDYSHRPGKKMTKTLDGKLAGLQSAKNLTQELLELKQREEKVFQEMDASLSGRGAAAIQRDRKTGMKRDFEREQAEQRAKDEEANKSKEKYTRWGKGLKQTEDQQDRLANDLYEMSKPLARYADDTDLDKHLRDQDRDGDPMLEYLRNKKREESKSKVPIYQGSFPPNRYNIRPGYRWDGVDRSNGYEKKRFDAINAKKAVEEEAYKWSTSDM